MILKIKNHLILLLFFFLPLKTVSQIDAIKGLAEGGAEIISSLGGSDACFSCCWDNGTLFFIDFFIHHHEDILKLKDMDPTVISFEARAAFALGLHPTTDTNYIYVNYLPGLRGNLGVFSTDFRFNILMEYSDDFPNSFSSWEWLFLLNIETSENFKLTFGTGVQMEKHTDSYYNEHYLGLKIGIADNRDFLDLDTRVSMDYVSGAYPFIEYGIRYNTRIINFNNVYVYITLGGIYQNYYQAHAIWAAQGGISINIH